MPAITEPFGSWKAAMFYADHPPPHVHIVGMGQSVRFRLTDAQPMDGLGLMSLRDSKRISAWIEGHRHDLFANWRRAERGEQLVRLHKPS